MKLPIWITTLPKIENWNHHYNSLCSQLDAQIFGKFWLNSNNFPIKDDYGVWDNLYQNFFDKVQQIFGKIIISENNSRTTWCYASNKNFYKSGIHNHMTTSVINAVYYFSVPETTEYRDGAIAFYNNANEEIWCYKPKECDLVIIPNYLKHQPLHIKSEKYRFAINMEIICEPFEPFRPLLRN